MTTFTDDFNRANGAPGANWVDTSGLWTIVSNQLSSGSAGGTIVIRAATAMATNDNSAQVTIAATGAVSHGVWCRGNTGFTQGYLWRNDGTSWNLFSNVGGSFTSIGSFAGAAVAGDIAKITAVGSTIKGFVNGVERVSVVNTAVTTGTSVGIRAESTNLLRFDDFTGADVTSGATGDAALSSTATLSASGVYAAIGNTTQTTTAGLSTTGQLAAAGSASAPVTATVTADGTRTATAAAATSTTAALIASGTTAALGAATLTATLGLTADGQRATTGNASTPATVGLSAAGATAVQGAASTTATAVTTTAGTLNAAGAAALAATSTINAAAALHTAASSALTAAAHTEASGTVTASGPSRVLQISVHDPHTRWNSTEPGEKWKTTPAKTRWTTSEPPTRWQTCSPGTRWHTTN